VAIVGFGISAAAIVVAPLLLGEQYNWVERSVSESAAQQTTGAWLGRLTLLLSGLATLVVCVTRARVWGAVATTAFALFGFLWALTAIYSTRSWMDGVPFNQREDALHSVFASAMAIICLGALVLVIRGRYASPAWRAATVGLVVAATLLPLGAVLVPECAGVFQRGMFFWTYFWLIRESLHPLVAGKAASRPPLKLME
jgi:hypothetical protein